MADLKISQLNSLAGSSLANNDVLAVVDTSASETKKITSKELVQYGYGLVDASTLDGDIIEPGTTSARGTIQLTDSTGSTSTTTAATPNAVKSAYDLANAALPKTGGTMTGQILGDNSTSASTPGYAFDGDPNTGLYTTGADELALTTGGSARLTIDSTGTVVIPGNFTVQGTTTTIDTTTLVVEDKNIEMGAVATPSDVTADGGGITLKGTTDKTINWVDATDAWTSSERFSVPTGTAAAPTLTFTGDPNTGIYSPGADQVAISTNGTERFLIGSTGSILSQGGPWNFSRYGGASANLVVNGFDGTQAAPTAVATSRSIGGVQGTAYDGTAGRQIGGIALWAEAAPTSISSPGFISFTTTPAGSTTPTERLRITSAGLVGVGSSVPTELLTVGSDATGNNYIRINSANNTEAGVKFYGDLSTTKGYAIGYEGDGNLFFVRSDSAGTVTDRLVINDSGNVGIGTTSPDALLSFGAHIPANGQSFHVFKSGNSVSGLGIVSGQHRMFTASDASLVFGHVATTDASTFTERARIDSSGRLLVGTSSARGNFFNSTFTPGFQIEAPATDARMASIVCNAASAAGSYFILGKTRSASVGGTALVSAEDEIGSVDFQAADGSELVRAASIAAVVDGTPGANDMPGRLVFSTTADGASSPTERLRITNNGSLFVGRTDASSFTDTAGAQLGPGGDLYITRNSNNILHINRLTNDGDLVTFYQAGISEGTISVSGTTVSYNGAHLSRWSQLPSGAERTEILRGTVLSNIDEMCEWGDEDNEQLNRMKVSNIEGDKNVSGVFQAWDDDDDTYTNDFYCAMTGDFIIRIGAGVTVERGDLLMSAGDGTAKPQDDDIIRSKTIAKVTSTNVSCTYEDGSYCVPCVLMAC